jgi:hypothetical protein
MVPSASSVTNCERGTVVDEGVVQRGIMEVGVVKCMTDVSGFCGDLGSMRWLMHSKQYRRAKQEI